MQYFQHLTHSIPVHNGENPAFLQNQIGPEAQTTRVMVVDSGILLDDVLINLLVNEPAFELSYVPMNTEKDIARLILEEKPHTILLCKSEKFSAKQLCTILENTRYEEPYQVITISIKGSNLEIQRMEKFPSCFSELLNLVKQSPRENNCI